MNGIDFSANMPSAIIPITLLFFAYVFSITFAGSLQAIIAKSMGDETADEMGYADFNPIAHINWLSLIFFLLLKFMAGQSIPVDIRNIRRSYYKLRLAWVFGSRCLFYLLFSILSILALLLLHSPTTTTGSAHTALAHMISGMPETTSPLVVLLADFCKSMLGANVLLAMFSGIQETVNCIAMYKFEKDPAFMEYFYPIMIFAPLALIFFFGNDVIDVFATVVMALAFKIALIIGIM